MQFNGTLRVGKAYIVRFNSLARPYLGSGQTFEGLDIYSRSSWAEGRSGRVCLVAVARGSGVEEWRGGVARGSGAGEWASIRTSLGSSCFPWSFLSPLAILCAWPA